VAHPRPGSRAALCAVATIRLGVVCALLTICLAVAVTCAPSGAWGSAGPCPDPTLTPTSANLARVKTAVLCLINQERERAGEGALRANARIEAAAQGHSEAMATEDYFEHVSPGGETPLQRLRASGYVNGASGYEVGENIAWGTYELATPQAIVRAWMQSPEHRANILDARFRDTAIGVCTPPPAALAHGEPGAIYTQDFGVLIGGEVVVDSAAHSDAGPDSVRPLPTKRRSKGHGSTRRKVRHRHRLRPRHRSRHRRTVRGAGRKRPHQRSRRRRR
jgi:uncharacterized protein YkwD